MQSQSNTMTGPPPVTAAAGCSILHSSALPNPSATTRWRFHFWSWQTCTNVLSTVAGWRRTRVGRLTVDCSDGGCCRLQRTRNVLHCLRRPASWTGCCRDHWRRRRRWRKHRAWAEERELFPGRAPHARSTEAGSTSRQRAAQQRRLLCRHCRAVRLEANPRRGGSATRAAREC